MIYYNTLVLTQSNPESTRYYIEDDRKGKYKIESIDTGKCNKRNVPLEFVLPQLLY